MKTTYLQLLVVGLISLHPVFGSATPPTGTRFLAVGKPYSNVGTNNNTPEPELYTKVEAGSYLVITPLSDQYFFTISHWRSDEPNTPHTVIFEGQDTTSSPQAQPYRARLYNTFQTATRTSPSAIKKELIVTYPAHVRLDYGALQITQYIVNPFDKIHETMVKAITHFDDRNHDRALMQALTSTYLNDIERRLSKPTADRLKELDAQIRTLIEEVEKLKTR